MNNHHIGVLLNLKDLYALIEALEMADVMERFGPLAERLEAARKKLEDPSG